MKRLPLRTRIYILITYGITVIGFIYSCLYGYIGLGVKSWWGLLFFIALIALTESYTVYFNNISFSTSFAIQLAVFLIYGPFITILSIIAGFSFRVMKVGHKQYKHIFNTPLFGTIFNYCALIFPVIIGNYFFIKYNGTGYKGFELNMQGITSVTIFSLTYFFVNVLILSILYSLMKGKNIIYSFINNVKLSVLNILAMIPFGIFFAYVYEKISFAWVSAALFPIILLRYTLSLYIDVKNQYVQTVYAIMNSIEARDKYTEGHSKRVAEISIMIAKEMGFNQWQVESLNTAAMLHDVGKIGVSDAILNKPGKLTDEEYERIKAHPEIGYNILKDIKNLDYASKIARYHHERYSGGGYPTGKFGDELPIDVYIVQLADAIDAMGTDRPYRKRLSEEEIDNEIRRFTGSQFHPKVVEAYFKALSKKRD